MQVVHLEIYIYHKFKSLKNIIDATCTKVEVLATK